MIGERLKEERLRIGLTQPVFAGYCGAKKRTLIEWEKGSTSPNAVQLSALVAIGVDVLYVLTGDRAGKNTHELTAKPPLNPIKSDEALADKTIKKQDNSYKNQTDKEKPLTNGKSPSVGLLDQHAQKDDQVPSFAGSNHLLLADTEQADYDSHNNLTPREKALLDNYRHIPDKEDQGVIEKMALIAARAAKDGDQTTGTEKKAVEEKRAG